MRYFVIFLFSCLIGVSCFYQTKHKETNVKKELSRAKDARMKFSSLAFHANNNTSALKIYDKYDITKYIQKSIKLSNWIETMKYPPYIYICKKSCFFLLSVTKNPTGLDSNFYHWIILSNGGYIIADFVSLSKNINNCYMKDGEIHMVIYNYADEYFFKEHTELTPIVERDFIVKDSLILNDEREFYVQEN